MVAYSDNQKIRNKKTTFRVKLLLMFYEHETQQLWSVQNTVFTKFIDLISV